MALSRVKSPDGLTLLREVQPSDFMINDVVKKFYDNNYVFDVKKKVVVKKDSSKKTSSSKSVAKKKTCTSRRTVKSVSKKLAVKSKKK